MKIFKLIAVYVFFVSSCSTKENIYDKAIRKCEDSNIKELNNFFISYRGVGDNDDEVILMLNKFNSKCPPHILTVNRLTKEIIKIDKKLINDKCDYDFSKIEIEKYVNTFLNLDFIVLGVDMNNNIYLNPNKQQEPCLVKFVKIDEPNFSSKYVKYKDNWYLKK